MNKICFHFQISQPYRLRTYRFFDINQDHHYFDDYQNQYLTKRLAERCYGNLVSAICLKSSLVIVATI